MLGTNALAVPLTCALCCLSMLLVWDLQFDALQPDRLFSCAQDGNLYLWDFNYKHQQREGLFAARDNVAIYHLVEHIAYVINMPSINPTQPKAKQAVRVGVLFMLLQGTQLGV
jgi:hypothetical protein